jgi:hypothetical protein
VSVLIDLDFANFEDALFGILFSSSSQDGVNSGNNFIDAKWFSHIVIATYCEASDFVTSIISSA